MPRKMKAIIPLENYNLLAEYTDGEKRVRDITGLLDGQVFAPLRNPSLFKTVKLVFGAPTWISPDGYEIDLCPDAFYMESQPYVEKDGASQ